MIEFEDAVSERMAQLEQEDLERYQRDLDLQRRIVQMRRPIQRFEMRVSDYYTRFGYWKDEMISVGYPDDESSYIDDFIGNLQWHIQLRVSNHRSRISRLVDAYYEAQFEETTILLERMVKDLKTANDIDEMANQTTIKIQRDDDICITVEEESIDNSHQDKSNVENLKAVIADKLLSNSLVMYEETGQNEENYCVVLGKMDDQDNACKVFAKMPEPIPTENLFDIEVAKANHYVLDERPVLSPVDLDENFIQDVSYADDISNSPSLSKLGFNLHVFDPGTLAHFKQEVYRSQLNANESQLHRINSVLSQVVSNHQNDDNRVVVMRNDAQHMFDETTPTFRTNWIDGQLLEPYSGGVDGLLKFIFDPGIRYWHLTWTSSGCQWPPTSCDRKYSMSSSRGVVPELFCNAHETYDNGMEGIDRGKIVMKNDASRVLEEMIYPNSLTLRETFSVVLNAANKGFSSMLDTKQFQASETVSEWDKVLKGTCVTACTPAIFIFPKAGIHMLDKKGDWHNDVPKLLKKITNPSPTGLQHHFNLFSSIEDYYTDYTWRKDGDCAPNADKMLINELGEFYSSQNNGSGIGHQFLDKMLGSFTSKLQFCGSLYRHLWLSVAELLQYLGYEVLATKFLFKLKYELNISFWLGMVSMFIFYPGAGAIEGQWNAYGVHVNVKCNCAVMIFGDSEIMEGAMVHPKDVGPDSLPIEGVSFEIAGRILVALTYTEHMACTLLSSNSSAYQNASVQRVTHSSFHLHDGFKPSQSTAKRCSDNEHLNAGTKANVAKRIENGVHMNLHGIRAVFVEILTHSVTSLPFDLGGCYLLLIICGVYVCIADLGVTKACKPQTQALVDHLSWVEEALKKGDVGFPSAINMLLGILIKGTQIVVVFTWHIKVHGQKMVVLAGATILDNFVWDPGHIAMFFYILEDKDVFERVGKWMILMDHATRPTITTPMFMNPGKDHFRLQQARDISSGNISFAIDRSLHFQLGYVFVSTPIKVILMNSAWLRVWKCHLDGRKAWVLPVSTKMESFIWKQGIFCFPCSYATLPRSHYLVFYSHGRATILPSEAVLHWPILFYGSVLSGFVAVHLANIVPRFAMHKSGTFVHIMGKLKVQEGAAGELKTSLTNGIVNHIQMIGQGQHINEGAALLKNIVSDPEFCHFTTLRTRRLLRGRTCHDPRFKCDKYELLSVMFKYIAFYILEYPEYYGLYKRKL